MIKFFFFWVRPHWGCFLILPSPLFCLSPRWSPTTTFHPSTRFLFPLSLRMAFPMTLRLKLTQEEQRGTGAGFQLWGHNPWWLRVTSAGRQCSGLYWRGGAAGNGAGSTDTELPSGMREVRMTAVERSCAGSKEWCWNKEGARDWVTETS